MLKKGACTRRLRSGVKTLSASRSHARTAAMAPGQRRGDTCAVPLVGMKQMIHDKWTGTLRCGSNCNEGVELVYSSSHNVVEFLP